MNKRRQLENYITENIDSAYRFAYTYVRNTYDAEDIVNESVVKALSSVHSLRNPQYIKPWFYKIIANTAISLIRSRNKSPESICIDCEKLQITDDYSELSLNSIISVLEIKYREIIVLRFLEDMSIKDIASVLSENESTVKTRLYQGLKILKNDIKECDL